MKSFDHKKTVKTISESVFRFRDAYRDFMNHGDGERYKVMEEARESMFRNVEVEFNVTFFDEVTQDMRKDMETVVAMRNLREDIEKVNDKSF